MVAGPCTQVLRPVAPSASATAELVSELTSAATAELCAACHAATGGNPFYLAELLAELHPSEQATRPSHPIANGAER